MQHMQPLEIVLVVKIALTLLLWSIPLMLIPLDGLRKLGFPVQQPEIFLRLLGMAYLSLGLCYFFGLQSQQDKIYPSDTVWIGILSNGGAFAVLLNSGVRTTNWKEWGSLAKVFMWISLFATGMICSSLVIFGPLR